MDLDYDLFRLLDSTVVLEKNWTTLIVEVSNGLCLNKEERGGAKLVVRV
jgi:hypothetical protein